MNFERGQEPKDAIKLGKSGDVKKWFDDENYDRKASHTVTLNGNVISVKVNGNLVLDRFDPEGIKEDFHVKIGKISGECTILNRLDKQDLYLRIKSFYNRVLDHCLGKTPDEQKKYLYGNESGIVKLKNGVIEDSEDLIRNLPKVPTEEKLIEIANQILSVNTGELEYAYHARDEYAVEMSQYANEIIKRLKD